MRTRFVLLLAALACLGCGTFDPQPDPTRFYLMSAIPEESQGTDALAGVVVGLGPVYIAPYVDQQKLVTRMEPNRVEFAEFERWAEPFDDHFIRILGQAVHNRTDPEALLLYPFLSVVEVDVHIEIALFRFDRTADGGAEMEVDWLLRSGGRASDPVLAKDDVVMREDATPTGPNGTLRVEDSVQAMSRLLSRLSERLADELVQHRSRYSAGGAP